MSNPTIPTPYGALSLRVGLIGAGLSAVRLHVSGDVRYPSSPPQVVRSQIFLDYSWDQQRGWYQTDLGGEPWVEQPYMTIAPETREIKGIVASWLSANPEAVTATIRNTLRKQVAAEERQVERQRAEAEATARMWQGLLDDAERLLLSPRGVDGE